LTRFDRDYIYNHTLRMEELFPLAYKKKVNEMLKKIFFFLVQSREKNFFFLENHFLR
jgi:hypothetical protein